MSCEACRPHFHHLLVKSAGEHHTPTHWYLVSVLMDRGSEIRSCIENGRRQIPMSVETNISE